MFLLMLKKVKWSKYQIISHLNIYRGHSGGAMVPGKLPQTSSSSN